MNLNLFNIESFPKVLEKKKKKKKNRKKKNIIPKMDKTAPKFANQ